MGGRGLCLHGDNLQVKVYFHQQYSTTNSEFVHGNSNCVTEWYIGMLKKWLNYHLQQSMKILRGDWSKPSSPNDPTGS